MQMPPVMAASPFMAMRGMLPGFGGAMMPPTLRPGQTDQPAGGMGMYNSLLATAMPGMSGSRQAPSAAQQTFSGSRAMPMRPFAGHNVFNFSM